MSDKPLNVVVIKTDQQRIDTIRAHGNEWMITPNLDRIANEGVSFTNATCCGATCIASRAAFYTGQYAHNTGCYSFNRWAHNRTWVHEIRDAGYRTAAIGKVHHSPHDPFAPSERFLRMYDNIEVPMPHKDRHGLAYRPPYYHGRDNNVHNPPTWKKPPAYDVPKFDIRGMSDSDMLRMRRHYYAQITQLDEQVGAILSALESRGLLENTLILFTSDHGENFGDHDIMYKWVMTEQTVRILMLFRLPGSQRGGTVDSGLFSHIDIGPTLLTALGLNTPDRLDGRSNWKRLTEGDSAEAPGCVYCEDKHLTMAHTGDRKLILYTGEESEEYFDLKTDPWEENNLSEDPNYRDEVKSLKADMLKSILESRYTGSLPQVEAPNGAR